MWWRLTTSSGYSPRFCSAHFGLVWLDRGLLEGNSSLSRQFQRSSNAWRIFTAPPTAPAAGVHCNFVSHWHVYLFFKWPYYNASQSSCCLSDPTNIWPAVCPKAGHMSPFVAWLCSWTEEWGVWKDETAEFIDELLLITSVQIICFCI